MLTLISLRENCMYAHCELFSIFNTVIIIIKQNKQKLDIL